MAIPFNKSFITSNSELYVIQALNGKTSGDGTFTEKCSSWLEKRLNIAKALLTTSGTHALEMAAYLCGIKENDEVIMSSFTFSSTANAFVKYGAKIVFVDIRPDTMNINETLIEDAITSRTKVIVPMHYAGIPCEMATILNIAKKHNIFVVEDAAQGMMSEYQGIPLGTLGDFNCFSFHETKNYSMGEGGALLLRNNQDILSAEIIREKGTNRSRFFRGEIDKYSWVNWGSSYLPSEINVAYLWSQLEIADEINNTRLKKWNQYFELLTPLKNKGLVELPFVPNDCRHNAHIFYIKVANNETQCELLTYLKKLSIGAVFHYVPLHTSEAGLNFGKFHGEDKYTTFESSRLIRLPLYNALSENDINVVVANIYKYFKEE